MNETEQTLKQKKIALAQSEHGPTVIEMLKDCVENIPLVTDTEWGTIVNTIKFDAQSSMVNNMINLMNDIKNGKYINNEKT